MKIFQKPRLLGLAVILVNFAGLSAIMKTGTSGLFVGIPATLIAILSVIQEYKLFKISSQKFGKLKEDS